MVSFNHFMSYVHLNLIILYINLIHLYDIPILCIFHPLTQILYAHLTKKAESLISTNLVP